MKHPRASAPLFVLLLLTCLSGSVLQAQTIRGTVIDRQSAEPVRGALVVLLDESGAQRAGSLSNDRGEFLIVAPAAGRYAVRAQRVGYSDGRSSVMAVDVGETVSLRLQVETRAIELEGIAVQATRRCTVRPQEGLLVSRLWDEARKALGAAEFTEREEMYGYQVRGYRRLLDLRSLQVLHDSSGVRETFGRSTPYASLPADSLLRHGFIQMDGNDPVYYAPDAHVLLSDEFLDSYCLRPAVPRDDEALVGIAFQPIERRGPPAVTGTLWLDRDSYELRYLDYGYTRVASSEQRDSRIGGRVEFEALPNGAWIVRRWRIRMPVVQVRQSPVGPLGSREQRILAGIAEGGGEVLEIRAGSARRTLRELAVLEGMVYDSARAAPVAGAMVFLSGTSHADTTDERGRYRLADVGEGEYQLSFTHPELRRLNIHPPPVPVSVAGETHLQVDLGVPRHARALALGQICREGSAAGSAGAGALSGHVLDEMTGAALPQARIVVSWGTAGGVAPRSVAVRAAADGSFLACGLPTDLPLVVQGTQGTRTGDPVSLGALGEIAFAEQELTVPFTRGESIVLVLRDWETGQPIRDAAVTLPGRNIRALTDRDGRARLENVPVGAHRFEIQHVAYGSIPDELHVEEGTGELEVRVPSRVLNIAGVEVVARSAVDLARRTSGTRLSLMTRDQIELRLGTARHVGDLARRLPGVRVRDLYYPGTATVREVCLETTRGVSDPEAMISGDPECPARIQAVVDGVLVGAETLLTIPLEQIESVQFISSAEGALQYGTMARNGALVIHSRGLGPFRARTR